MMHVPDKFLVNVVMMIIHVTQSRVERFILFRQQRSIDQVELWSSRSSSSDRCNNVSQFSNTGRSGRRCYDRCSSNFGDGGRGGGRNFFLVIGPSIKFVTCVIDCEGCRCYG